MSSFSLRDRAERMKLVPYKPLLFEPRREPLTRICPACRQHTGSRAHREACLSVVDARRLRREGVGR